MGLWGDLFGGDAEKEAAAKDQAAAQSYQNQALGYLQSGYGSGTTALNQGISAYNPLAQLGQQYNQAGTTWLNALGVNGPQAQAQAQSAFTASPGFHLTQQTALDAIDRRRAIGGMYASGNADQDTSNWITQNLYQNQYQPWMQGLQSAAGMGGQYTGAAAQGQQQGYTSLADLASQYAQNQSNIAGNVMNTDVAANNLAAAGEAQGAKNLLGAGLSIAGMVAAPFTGGLSTALGGLANMSGLGSTLGGMGITYGLPGTATSNLFGPAAPR